MILTNLLSTIGKIADAIFDFTGRDCKKVDAVFGITGCDCKTVDGIFGFTGRDRKTWLSIQLVGKTDNAFLTVGAFGIV